MTIRTAPRQLRRDTATYTRSHGRTTSPPAGHVRRRAIAEMEVRKARSLSHEEFCSLVDNGTMHRRAISSMLGKARSIRTYPLAHAAAISALNNKGPGAASEIVATELMLRAGLCVDTEPRCTDLEVVGRLLEVKSSYEDSVRNARKGHQVAVSRKQLADAEFFLAALVFGPGARGAGDAETVVHWVFAPMAVVRNHVETRLAGQLRNEEITLHFRPKTAVETFSSYTHSSAGSLYAAIAQTFAS